MKKFFRAEHKSSEKCFHFRRPLLLILRSLTAVNSLHARSPSGRPNIAGYFPDRGRSFVGRRMPPGGGHPPSPFALRPLRLHQSRHHQVAPLERPPSPKKEADPEAGGLLADLPRPALLFFYSLSPVGRRALLRILVIFLACLLLLTVARPLWFFLLGSDLAAPLFCSPLLGHRAKRSIITGPCLPPWLRHNRTREGGGTRAVV